MDSKPDFQKIYEDQSLVPFRIIKLGEKGFSVRVYGFKAFIAFDFMPFKYDSIDSWKAVLPYLKKIEFSAKIKAFIEEKQFLILNAAIPQFEPIKPDTQTVYSGIIVEKFSSRTILELGAAFDWKHGSVKAVLPNSKRDRIISITDLNIGDSLSVFICSGDKPFDADYLVQGSISSREWENGSVRDLLNKKVSAKVIYQGKNKVLVLDGKYKGEMDTSDKWYRKSKLRYAIKSMVQNLREGDEITVEVKRIKESLQVIEVIWFFDK